MKNILLTGASGLVGKHLVPILAAQARVWCLGRSKEPDQENVRWIEADLSCDLPTEKLPKSIDAVVYLAQSRRFREFPDAATDMFAVNTVAPLKLAQWGRDVGVKDFVYASTGGVYAPSAAPVNEASPLIRQEEMGFYPATKLAAERLLSPFASCFDVILLRPFFIYGPGQVESMLVPRLLESIRKNIPITLPGGEGLRANPTYVSDFCYAVIRALSLGQSAIVNVAGPETISLRELVKIVAIELGKTPILQSVEHAGDIDLFCDIERQCQMLGAPKVSVQEGIKLTLGSNPGQKQ